MENIDNKTKLLHKVNLADFSKLLENNPAFIATVSGGGVHFPNLSVASDVKVIGSNELIISVNEMINTPDNIQKNENIMIVSLDGSAGIRLSGTAKFFDSGKYFEMCNQYFKTPETCPKGVIVVDVTRAEML